MNDKAFVWGDPEEQLRRRMAAAKSAGWSDDQVSRAALVAQQSQKQAAAQKQAQAAAAAKAKKPSGLKSFLVNGGAIAASTLAGLGGIAAAPVTGGASLVGAFGAGAGIEALRRKMLGEQQSVGADLVNGGLTAIPVVGQLNKIRKGAQLAGDVAKTATTANAARDATRQVATVVPKMAPRAAAADTAATTGSELPGNFKQLFHPDPTGVISGRVDKAGTQLRATNRGVTPGLRPDGEAEKLTASQAAERNAYLDANTKGGVNKQLQQVGKQKEDASAQIKQIVEGNAQPVTDSHIMEAQGRIEKSLLGENGVGAGKFNPNNTSHMEVANNYARQMAGITDSKGWLGFKRTLDKDINYARNSMSPDPVGEQVASAFRKEANGQLKTLHPEISDANKAYSEAQKAESALLSSRQLNPTGFKPAGTSLNGQGLGGGTLQTAADFAGRGGQNLAKIISTPAFKTAAAQYGLRAATVGEGGAPYTAPVDPNAAQDPATAMDPNAAQDPNSQTLDFMSQQGATDVGGFNADDPFMSALTADPTMTGDPSAAASNDTGYSSNDLFQAAIAAQSAGDLKNSDQFLQLAQYAAAQEKEAAKAGAAGSGAGGANVTKVTAQQYGLAQSGATAVQQLSSMLQQDPSLVTKTAIPGKSLPGIGGFIANASGTGQYDAVGYNIADTILRLRTGATANEGEVKKLQTQLMPRAGDSQTTIQQKLSTINSIFSNVLNLAGSSPSSSTADDLLSQLTQSGAY